VHERSFDQEPRIEPIENPFAVYLSPVRKADGTDPLWAHVISDYSHDDYVAEFGAESTLAKLNFPTQQGAAQPDWVTKDGARVAEYWWMELKSTLLHQLDDGSTLTADELDAEDKIRVVGTRDTIVRKVHCVVHDAMRVLKKYDYLGIYIPLPEVNGVRLNVNGKIYRAGMVRDYRDAQRIYDFMVTRAVEQVDQCSKDPLWIPESKGNANHAEEYRQMNRKNYSHMWYEAWDEQGRQLPPPQRAGRDAQIGAMRELIQQADYDMKAVIGIYGPSLGEESGSAQESGFAIMSRKEQSDTGSMTWHDQLNRAIVWQGKILLDLWPKLIPAARVQRIINPDDSVKHQVVFNSKYSDPAEAMQMLNAQLGMRKAYDVGAGYYDVVLSTGPMYRTARQEAFKAMSAVIQSDPQVMLPLFGDIWMKNGDFPDAELAAARFKKMLPPNLQDADADDVQTQLAQKDAQLKALSDQHNLMVQELTRASDTIRTKRLDLESRERVALWNNWTQLMLQRLKAHDAAAQAALDAQLEAIQMRMQGLHENLSIEEEAGAAPNTPELPGQVEPKVQPVTPAAPTPRPQPVGM
jgi:hypothetical protein